MEDQLRDLLGRLHEELEQGPPVDESTRALLREVLGDIDRALEPSPPASPPPEPNTLGERLRGATWNLEQTHPKLTSVVEQMIETLGRVFQ